MGSLDGQIALVTGCGRRRGLGRGIALQLANAGANVAITDVATMGRKNIDEPPTDPMEEDWKGLASLATEIESLGRRCLPITGDVGLKTDAERMVAEAIDQLGQVDIVVNNAAAPQSADRNWSWAVPEEAFDEQMRVNAKGVFLMSTAVVRHLIEREAPSGRIVNISSGLGHVGSSQRAAYCASKFAIIGITQSMALELGPMGITVNAVCPGAMETSRHMARTARTESDSPAASTASPFPAPVPRLGQPTDIARAVLFLAEPGASYITGQSIHVGGGTVLR